MENIRLFFNILITILCFIVEDFITRSPLSMRVIALTLLNCIVCCLLIDINYTVCELISDWRKEDGKGI